MNSGIPKSVPYRCPSCRPSFRVMRIGGRRAPWQVPADYVGFLFTAKFEGRKMPPSDCPNCGTRMVPCPSSN